MRRGAKGRVRLAVERLEDRTLLSVTLSSGFAGISFNDTTAQAEPPDPIAAAGPNHVVELVNSTLRIYDKAGNVLSTQQLPTFFASLNPATQSDPTVMYDELAGRWIIATLDYSSTLAPNSYDFAISNDSDPTHGFTMTKINIGEGSFFADYPRAGFNADAYFITFNMFQTNFFQSYDHVQVLTINKASVTGASGAAGATFTQVDGSSANFTVVPAVMHGSVAGGPEWFVEGANTGGSGSTVTVLKMTNVLSSSPSFTATSISVPSYGAPPAANQPGGTITTNDSRMLSVSWRGDELVAAQTIGSGSVAHARWYQFSTAGASPTLTQSGDIDQGSGVSTFFPAIDIATNGDLGVVFMESSSSEFWSVYVTGRTNSDATGTMETPKEVLAGNATYTGSRAGDFSGITFDPSSGTAFWAASEYKPSSAFWGTAIGNFSLTAPVGATHFIVTAPSSSTAGSSFSITVTALDANNSVVTNYAGTVHFTSSDTNSSVVLPTDYAFQPGDSGAHTFTGVTLVTAGNQSVAATDTSNSTVTGSATVTINPASATGLGFVQQPTNTAVNSTISPAVTVQVVDAYGNRVTSDNSDQVTLAIGTNPGGGALSGTNPVTVSSGLATFNNLSINQVGNGYTLTAGSGTLNGATSNSFNITNGVTVIEDFDHGGTYNVINPPATAQVTSVAAHDGPFGLRMSNGNDWIYNNDSAHHVQQGETLSLWIQLASKADGRAYFGFGASGSGTLSIVLAANTNQLIIMKNINYGFTNIGSVKMTYTANHWYRVEVSWASGGNITGRVYDSDGTTLLKTVTATTNSIVSGGIAFRGIGSDKYFDTVTMRQGTQVAQPVGGDSNPGVSDVRFDLAVSPSAVPAVSPAAVANGAPASADVVGLLSGGPARTVVAANAPTGPSVVSAGSLASATPLAPPSRSSATRLESGADTIAAGDDDLSEAPPAAGAGGSGADVQEDAVGANGASVSAAGPRGIAKDTTLEACFTEGVWLANLTAPAQAARSAHSLPAGATSPPAVAAAIAVALVCPAALNDLHRSARRRSRARV
jgi:hypothetical protein